MRSVINYIAGLFCLGVLYGFIAVWICWWAVDTEIFGIATSLQRWGFIVLIGFPYLLGMGGYCFFWGNSYHLSQSFFSNTLGGFLVFIGGVCLFLLLQFFVGGELIVSSLPTIGHTEKTAQSIKRQQRQYTRDLLKLYHKADKHSMEKAGQWAQELHKRYPRNLQIERVLLQTKRHQFSLETEKKTHQTAVEQDSVSIKKASLMEQKAIEAENNSDYVGAALHYEKLIKIFSSRHHTADRQAYVDRRALCLAKAADPNTSLTEEELHARSLNRQLERVRDLLKRRSLREAFAAAREIYLHYEDQPHVKELYDRLSKQVLQEDFFLWEIQAIANEPLYHRPSSSNVSMHIGNLHLQASQAYLYMFRDRLFIAGNITCTTPEQTFSYPYAKMYKQTLLLQGSPTKPAVALPTSMPVESLVQSIDLMKNPNKWGLYLSMPVFSIITKGRVAETIFGLHPLYFNALLIYQACLLLFVLYLFFWSVMHSVRYQDCLLHPINVLAIGLRMAGWMLLYVAGSLAAGLWMTLSSTKNDWLPLVLYMLLWIVFVVSVFVRVSRHSLVRKTKKNATPFP